VSASRKQERAAFAKLSYLSELIGTTLTKIELHPFDDGRGNTLFDPVFEFSNGSRLRFHVQRDELGRTGVDPRLGAG